MAKREALRELQSRLAQRLQAAMTEVPTASWLAVHCGGQGLIFPLRTAGEIFTAAGVPPPKDKLSFDAPAARTRFRRALSVKG